MVIALLPLRHRDRGTRRRPGSWPSRRTGPPGSAAPGCGPRPFPRAPAELASMRGRCRCWCAMRQRRPGRGVAPSRPRAGSGEADVAADDDRASKPMSCRAERVASMMRTSSITCCEARTLRAEVTALGRIALGDGALARVATPVVETSPVSSTPSPRFWTRDVLAREGGGQVGLQRRRRRSRRARRSPPIRRPPVS